MGLRFGTVTLRRPKRADSASSSLTVSVVGVHEGDAPEGEKAVHWLLLSALPVDTAEQARQVTRWYSYRWLIERLHYVLKSGCKLEESQLSQEIRLERLLAVYTLVAWRILWLTYQARITPDAPCTMALEEAEWQALYLFTQKQRRLPKHPPTLREAVRWIAQLGGFLGRKGDGEPGVKALWRGWTRLQDIAATFTLLQPPQWVMHSSNWRGAGNRQVSGVRLCENRLFKQSLRDCVGSEAASGLSDSQLGFWRTDHAQCLHWLIRGTDWPEGFGD
ncbi:MAG: IS4 family transposase [Anaerolineae bacterium]|nr:IS4 family transposase [Anaerolineae bacterium]NUQ06336.1 IS4 family transposase [Anaerolineae bacterium]